MRTQWDVEKALKENGRIYAWTKTNKRRQQQQEVEEKSERLVVVAVVIVVCQTAGTAIYSIFASAIASGVVAKHQ